MARHTHSDGVGDPLRPSDSADVGQPTDDRLHRPGSGVPDPGAAPVDPELESDLGPELAFRGDSIEAELEACRAEAEACRVEAEAARDLALRTHAELENYRRRVTRDQAEMVNRAGERIIGEVLPVIDNLERAIEHVTAGGDLKQLLAGVEGVYRQLLDVLAREGVTLIDPFGQPFDPNQHQAMAQREDCELPEGTVVDVYQKGYEMHGKCIRPAMVVVSAERGADSRAADKE